MRKLLALSAAALVITAAYADDFYITGRIKTAIDKVDLPQAYLLFYDAEGNVSDSIRANQGRTWRNGAVDTIANFWMSIPRVDTTLYFDVKCDGFKTVTLTHRIDNIGKRERSRTIPTIYLERAPVVLNEVMVTTTKIKFYNKGDTVVYNADAFNLAEGSMLDALISQMPGAELSSDGQIKVNGEFVESLLLNGKEFMDGNNNVMLENIAAYTVKDVQVYQSQKIQDKRKDNVFAPKVLTMDVRLKKEYNMGWIVNAQGGYGTENRYLGKLFASWFTNETSVSLIGMANNLNDTRSPGRNDTWTPDQMPSGRKKNYMGGLNYDYERSDESMRASGNVLVRHSLSNDYTQVARTNFLPGGNTYDKSFGNSHQRSTNARTNNYFGIKPSGNVNIGTSLNASYSDGKSDDSNLSGTFDSDQLDMTMSVLDAIYSDGSSEALESILNRSKTRSDNWQRSYSGSLSPYISYKLPKSSDRISYYFDVDYSSTKYEVWRDYEINFGKDPNNVDRRRQFTDNTPNHSLNLYNTLSYSTQVGNANLGFDYSYSFADEVKDSYMYALDRLEDMGIYGVVPSDYLASLDAKNSYKSHTFTNTHGFRPQMHYNLMKENSYLRIFFSPQVNLCHRKLIYWRDNKDMRLSTQNTTVHISSIWSSMIETGFGKIKGRGFRNSLRYSFRIDPTLPDLVDMLDVVTDSDPLNIYVGNPDLKTQLRYNHLFRWSFTPASYTLNNVFYFGFIHTTNALVRGYTYNTSTGVRTNRMYNVNGDRRVAITNELSMQFGPKKQFSLSSATDASMERCNDMIGVDMETPQPYTIKHRVFSQNLKLAYQFSGQTVSLRCDFTNRHTTSARPDFDNLNANHINYGVSGVFSLPAGFGLSTDFICYTRRGYGVDYLDTTDPVWNARLSYSPVNNKKWVFMVDGFDLLHKLSNVKYAINAAGRTVTYTNTLPRYLMFSVQYRLNIQPKKR